jgi:hypothetical protein
VDARQNKSPKDEGSRRQESEKTTEQAQPTSQIDETIGDDFAIDWSSMPDFKTFEEGNAWILERQGEWWVKKCGRWQLFQNSQRVPGFKEAEASWKKASGEFLRREGYAKVISGPLSLEEMFFCQLWRDPSGALETFWPLVAGAARRGDLDFFLRIVRETKRVAARTKDSTVVLHLLNNWLHGFLWLMPSTWGSYYLQSITGGTVSQENYEKLRQRLKLVGWEAGLNTHPLKVTTPKMENSHFGRGGQT